MNSSGILSSPFPHQGPLLAEQVRGRESLVNDLVERATMRRVTALLGPRRFGKTSVLRKVESILDDAGSSVIWIDLYETRSAADLVVRVDDALSSALEPIRQRASSIAASMSINLGMFKLEFARPASKRPDADAALHIMFDLLVAAATSHPTVIIIDEFTGLNGVNGAAALLRTKLQHHVQSIGLLFAGSEPTAMTAMFTDATQPFYAQADIVEIEPFSPADLDSIVREGFRSTDRDAGDLAAVIHHFTGGHPYRSMQLADAAWIRSEPGLPQGQDRWLDALHGVRKSAATGLETWFSSFSSNEQAVLRAIAGGRNLFGASLELFGTSSGGVAAARDRLIADGTITKDLMVVDPLLADWIRQRFAL